MVFFSILLLLFLLKLIQAQSLCNFTSKDQNPNIVSTAFKSGMLSNGDLIVSGYRLVNGVPEIVVDRFNSQTCLLNATYTFPYFSPPPAAAPMQLLVSDDDFIGIRYFNTNVPGTNYFIILDSNLNQQSLLTINNSVFNRLMTFTKDDAVLLTLLYSAPSFGEKLKIRKVLRSNLSTTVWNSVIKFPSAEIRIVSDIKSDSSGNIYATGVIETNNNEMKLFVLKLNDLGHTEWIRTYKLMNNDWHDWMYAKLLIDKQQRIIIGAKSTDDSLYFLNLYCLAHDGTLLWKKKKAMDTIPSNVVWIDSDSLCNVYAVSRITGIHDYTSTYVCKLDANGNYQWKKTIPNFRVHSMKVNSAGSVYLAGDKYFTSLNVPLYKPHFKLLDTGGNETNHENEHYTFDTTLYQSGYSRYNDITITNTGDAYLVGERHNQKFSGHWRDFYFIDFFDSGNNITKVPYKLSEQSISVFPNPSPDAIFSVDLINSVSAYLIVYDCKGRIVYQNKAFDGRSLNLSYLSEGIYMLKLSTIDSTFTQRLVIIK